MANELLDPIIATITSFFSSLFFEILLLIAGVVVENRLKIIDKLTKLFHQILNSAVNFSVTAELAKENVDATAALLSILRNKSYTIESSKRGSKSVFSATDKKLRSMKIQTTEDDENIQIYLEPTQVGVREVENYLREWGAIVETLARSRDIKLQSIGINAVLPYTITGKIHTPKNFVLSKFSVSMIGPGESTLEIYLENKLSMQANSISDLSQSLSRVLS